MITYKIELSTVLLASFLLAMGGVLFCHTEDIIADSHHDGTDKHLSVTNSFNSHSGDHASEAPNDHHSKSHSEDECCDEQPGNLFLGLDKNEKSKFSFAKSLLHFKTIGRTIQVNLHPENYLKSKIDVILNNLPPPKISNIQILFQSFLN